MTLIGMTGGLPGREVALEMGSAVRTAVVRARSNPSLNDSGPIEDIFTVARASGGSSFEAGAWTWVGNDVPRYDQDGRLLSEPQSTNLWLRSDDVTNVAWQKLNVTAPSANQVREAATTTGHTIRQMAPLSNGDYTRSFDIKPVGRTEFRMVMETSSAFGNRAQIDVDLATGTATSVTNFGTYSGTTVTIGAVDADGYYRITISGATGTKNGDGSVWATVTPMVGGATTYLGDTNKGFDMRRHQVEQRSSATSYIPTVGSTVTRQADSITKPTAEFAWNGGDGILTIDGSPATPIIIGSDLDVSAMVAVAGDLSIGTLQWLAAA